MTEARRDPLDDLLLTGQAWSADFLGGDMEPPVGSRLPEQDWLFPRAGGFAIAAPSGNLYLLGRRIERIDGCGFPQDSTCWSVPGSAVAARDEWWAMAMTLLYDEERVLRDFPWANANLDAAFRLGAELAFQRYLPGPRDAPVIFTCPRACWHPSAVDALQCYCPACRAGELRESTAEDALAFDEALQGRRIVAVDDGLWRTERVEREFSCPPECMHALPGTPCMCMDCFHGEHGDAPLAIITPEDEEMQMRATWF